MGSAGLKKKRLCRGPINCWLAYLSTIVELPFFENRTKIDELGPKCPKRIPAIFFTHVILILFEISKKLRSFIVNVLDFGFINKDGDYKSFTVQKG